MQRVRGAGALFHTRHVFREVPPVPGAVLGPGAVTSALQVLTASGREQVRCKAAGSPVMDSRGAPQGPAEGCLPVSAHPEANLETAWDCQGRLGRRRVCWEGSAGWQPPRGGSSLILLQMGAHLFPPQLGKALADPCSQPRSGGARESPWGPLLSLSPRQAAQLHGLEDPRTSPRRNQTLPGDGRSPLAL